MLNDAIGSHSASTLVSSRRAFTLVELIVGLFVASVALTLAWSLFSTLHKGYSSKRLRSTEFQEQMMINAYQERWRDSSYQIECRFAKPYLCQPLQGQTCTELAIILSPKIETIQKYSCTPSGEHIWIEMQLQSKRISKFRF
jgi:prepilin-type N-terminal cleavage/methylation domain-containing protein